MSAVLTGLYLYPVKSCAGVAVGVARPEPRGLAGDRRWAVVDARGRILTQRQRPRLRLIEPLWAPEPDGGGTLSGLRAPGLPDLPLPEAPAGPRRAATLFGQPVGGVVVSAEAAAWLEAFVGVPCDLVALPDDAERWQPPDRPYRAPLAYSDGNPFHLITVASLAALAPPGARPPPALNFRPNFVIAGTPAFEEDRWTRLRIGAVAFEVVEACARCSVVNVDAGGRMTGQPLRSMVASRRRGRHILFGQHLILAAPAATPDTLRPGDAVTVEATSPEPNPCYAK